MFTQNQRMGRLRLKKIDATMLEIEGVNGEIKVLEGTILDNIIETVNGDVSISAAPESLSVSLINGDIRITAKEKRFAVLKQALQMGISSWPCQIT